MEDVLGGACIIWYGKLKNPYTVLVGKFEDILPLVNLGVIVWKIFKAEKVSLSCKYSELCRGGAPFKSSLPSSVPYANSMPWPSVL